MEKDVQNLQKTRENVIGVVSWKQVNNILKHCGHLESLEFIGCDLRDKKAIKKVSKHLASLKRFRLYEGENNLYTIGKEEQFLECIGDEYLLRLLKHASFLEEVWIESWDSTITNETMKFILNQSLKSLKLMIADFGYYERFIVTAFKDIDFPIMRRLQETRKESLETLWISLVKDLNLIPQFQNLKCLNLMSGQGIDIHFLEGITTLEVLSIRCTVSMEHLIKIALNNIQLKVLSVCLPYCEEEEFELLTIVCENLEVLICSKIRDSFLHHLHNLSKLSVLSSCSPRFDDYGMRFDCENILMEVRSSFETHSWNCVGYPEFALDKFKQLAIEKKDKFFFVNDCDIREMSLNNCELPKNLKLAGVNMDVYVYDYYFTDRCSHFCGDYFLWKNRLKLNYI
ncbi:hypothetical protein B4U80_13164 [Leptotrombidium deliense]|uniref:Uncharacterized protein n=1 Tax=Leptotrombidium deliense TaxID=299467 RepID=A0A443SBF2_9ACAR|nr:hypothetical protein B4U80_13164 [Leptotrombidium deliense]